jgi:hypothetical protein
MTSPNQDPFATLPKPPTLGTWLDWFSYQYPATKGNTSVIELLSWIDKSIAPTPTYRPFTWAELVAMAGRLQFEVKHKNWPTMMCRVVGLKFPDIVIIQRHDVVSDCNYYHETLDEVFRDYTYPDGTPFGKVVEGGV